MNNQQDDIFENLVAIFLFTLATSVVIAIALFFGLNLYHGLSLLQIWDSITPMTLLIGFAGAGYVSIPVALTVWFLDTVTI